MMKLVFKIFKLSKRRLTTVKDLFYFHGILLFNKKLLLKLLLGCTKHKRLLIHILSLLFASKRLSSTSPSHLKYDYNGFIKKMNFLTSQMTYWLILIPNVFNRLIRHNFLYCLWLGELIEKQEITI